ncbi:MAG: hypothetical protein ACR2OZ_10385 [Verrucomicrobiales bacterium]
MKNLLLLRCALAGAFTILAATDALAANSVTLSIERAPTLGGPWTRIDLATAPRDADGNPRLPVDKPDEFYRTRIELSPSTQPGDPIPLEEVPVAFTTRARQLLERRLATDAGGRVLDPEAWPEGARLGPHVYPMHSVMADGSVRPGYFEFKVLGPAPVLPGKGWLGTAPEDLISEEAGYILVSASEEDFPIAEFATRGETLRESLVKLAKIRDAAVPIPCVKIMRYGPTFAVAEDESGRLLASLGAMPFQLDPDVLALDGLEWSGDDLTGLDQSPRTVPELTPAAYRTYEEFKLDFARNDTYIKLREIKKQRAKLEWDLALGRPIQSTVVVVGSNVDVLTNLPPSPAPEFSFIAEDENQLVRVSPLTSGGLKIYGLALGDGVLRVRSGGQEFALLVRIVPALAPRNVGDVIESDFWYAGNWGDQPKYHQISRERWCPRVGCGPVAWAMLLAWFDREWGVEYSFRDEGQGTSPPPDTTGSSNQAKVIPAYDDLHELCDVICFGEFSDQGATWPPDMSDAIKDYTYPPALADLINRSWTINATTGTWPEAGALRCRDAIKNGYPAVAGLGWMWHYVLAYGYAYEKIEASSNMVLTIRYLKCNMGWGKDVNPRWYNMLDTFYAARFKITNG